MNPLDPFHSAIEFDVPCIYPTSGQTWLQTTRDVLWSVDLRVVSTSLCSLKQCDDCFSTYQASLKVRSQEWLATGALASAPTYS